MTPVPMLDVAVVDSPTSIGDAMGLLGFSFDAKHAPIPTPTAL